MQIDNVAGGDNMKWDAVEKLPVVLFLNMISYIDAKRKYQNEKKK